jgi:protein-S-isoprenylcysteine O-methyltransferase Ste14
MEGETSDDARSASTDDIWARGGSWVLAQFPLTALALLAARVGPTLPASFAGPARAFGIGLGVAGGLLFLAGLLGLGRGLTPFPKPLPNARLVQTGAFGLARHPVYGGGILAVAGWALLHGGVLGLIAAGVLALFFDAKASREERWLTSRFPEYAAYRRRVKKLIPFVY